MLRAITTANVIKTRLKLETFKPPSFAACRTGYNPIRCQRSWRLADTSSYRTVVRKSPLRPPRQLVTYASIAPDEASGKRAPHRFEVRDQWSLIERRAPCHSS